VRSPLIAQCDGAALTVPQPERQVTSCVQGGGGLGLEGCHKKWSVELFQTVTVIKSYTNTIDLTRP
jgi:hypothetical protein